MFYLLFVFYLILFCWLVTKVGFFRRSELSSKQLVLIFLFKVAVGIFYGWIGIYYNMVADASDTWFYHWESQKEFDLLLKDPAEFVTSLFHSSYEAGYGNFFSVTNSWWNDLKSNSFLKFLGVLNLFSFGNYYVNLIIFSFITLFGPVAIYRIMNDAFPGRKPQVFIGSFLLPSFIFWTSGIHKDGLIFLCIAIIMFLFYFRFRTGRWNAWTIVSTIFLLFIILLLRNFMVIVLVPALFAWLLAMKRPGRSLRMFAVVYLSLGIFFFTAKYIHPSLDFPAIIQSRQESFMKLEGSSTVQVDKIGSGFTGFVKHFPQAVYVSVFTPQFSQVHHLLSLAAALETHFYILLVVLFLIFRRKAPERNNDLFLFCLVIGCSILLIVGYSVNFMGALVRHRSIVLPLLLIPVIAGTDWKRLGKSIFNI